MFDLLLLIVGLAGLWAGSELLIGAAISLADRTRLSDAFIGMAVLAIGTDLPEIFVAADASLHSLSGNDYSGIVIGSAIGSCIGQFALVFGVAGCFGFAPRPFRLGLRNAVFLLGGLAVLAAFSHDGVITRTQGWLLIGCYAAYLVSLALWRGPSQPDHIHSPQHSIAKDVTLLLAGFVLLLGAAELTVTHAVGFAAYIGLSQFSVSAVIIGMGSSLPELSVSLVALWRGRGGLSRLRRRHPARRRRPLAALSQHHPRPADRPPAGSLRPPRHPRRLRPHLHRPRPGCPRPPRRHRTRPDLS